MATAAVLVIRSCWNQILENLPWSKPEQHNRVEFVNVRYSENGKHNEEEEMSQDEIRCKETKFGDFAQVFSTRLGQRMPSHVVPFACPPSNVG